MKCLNLARFAAAIISLSSSPLALAGGWIGGGGELLEDSMNPWFVQAGRLEASAQVVRYCIEADEQNFGVPLDSLRLHVKVALDYWADEFAEAYLPVNGPGNTNAVFVGKEMFVPMPTCDDSTPIHFQFGVLTAEQQQEFKAKDLDPRRFVALAARTEYDPKTLRSKGFIYLAPARGPLAMSTPDLQEDPWMANGQSRLYAVLRHELGHVFGIQHTGTHEQLMGSGFPEYAVAKKDNFYPPGGVFKIPNGAILQKNCYFEGDHIPDFLVAFFGAPATDKCIGLRMHPERLEIVSAKDDRAPVKVVGKAVLDQHEMILKFDPLVRVWLPKEQTIFQSVPEKLGHLLAGPMAVRRQARATFKNTEAGIERELMINLAPEALQIGGVWNGKILLDVFSHREPANP